MPNWPQPLVLVAVGLAATLPFAVIRPILTTPWGGLTDDRLLLLLATAAWLAIGRWPTGAETRALVPTLALVTASAISAALAPSYAAEALKSLWRLAAAGLVLLLIMRSGTARTAVLWAVILGAGVSALFGFAEAAAVPGFDAILGAFKVAPTTVGGELRVSASFQYATIAAMYFEMVVPLAISLAAAEDRRWLRILASAIAMLCAANVVLSFTRAGTLSLGVVCVGFLVVARRPTWRRVLWPTLLSLAVLVGGTTWLLVRDPVFNLRLTTENDADWYGADYVAPATLTLDATQRATVSLDVRNTGRMGWLSADPRHPFTLSYRWLTADASAVLAGQAGEVLLPDDVPAGETIHLEFNVEAPDLPPGSYRLEWDMVQRDVVQFYERGSPAAQTIVSIPDAHPGYRMPDVVPRDEAEAPWVVPRGDLWRAALGLFETRPLLGVGPDNFRRLYGSQLGLDAWDERVQANNLFLELLVDTGLLGLAAFAWVVSRPLAAALGRLRRRQADYVLLGAVLGVTAFLVHGLFDVFIAFTPTVLLFWLLLGTLSAQKPQVSGR